MENISTGIDSFLEATERLEIQQGLPIPMKDQVLDLHLEFRFLKIFSWCLKKYEETACKDINFDSVMIKIGALFTEPEQVLEEADLTIIPQSKIEDLNDLGSNLLEEVEILKPEIKEICDNFWECSLQSTSGTSDEIMEFIDLIFWNLRDLVNWKADLVVSVKKQIRVLQDNLCFIGNIVHFTANRCTEKQILEDFWTCMQGVMNNAASLSILYWIDGKDEKLAPRLETMLSDLLRKIKPYATEVIEMFVGVLIASKSSEYDKLLIAEIVASLTDFLLEDLVSPMKDRIEILGEGLVFLITFLMNPPEMSEREAGNVLWTRVNAVISEVVSFICSLYMAENKEDITPEMEICLSGVKDKIDIVRAEVREFVQISNLPESNFPTANGIGFIDYLLGNLKEMLKCKASSIPFAKKQVLTMQEELLSLVHFVKGAMELLNVQEEVNDLWKRIIGVSYQAEHVANSCLILENPIWYDMICLSSVIEEIKDIKTEIQKVNDQQIHNDRMPDAANNSSRVLPGKANASRIEEVVVGFKDEAEMLIDRLTRGSKRLDIISIVGMPGQGKTTLARKVYNDPSVKYYFSRCAWCCVSQVYDTRELLSDILSDLTGVDVQNSDSEASEEELTESIWKCLKGRRFLIVMDDIWETEAWNNIKISFPDDDIGSRIMFTSRIHNLVSQAKPNCSPFPLRPLSDEESWELLQEKLFHNIGCLSDLSEVGKKIAKKCEGLPLAVVLVAGILARKDINLDSWNQIKEIMGSPIASEGCMDILELSYKHLPDCLRPCFLYFGAFPEAKAIRVRKLMNLWIAEGFIQRNEVKSIDDMAGEYMMDLIDRSLVTIAARSSKGGIKACRIHDLLHDFCLAKVRELKILHWVHEHDVSNQSPNPKRYDHYRLCINGEWEQFIESRPTGPCVHSLLMFGIHVERCQHSKVRSFYLSFKFLNVLDLECIYFDDYFPEEITLMVHLRYLAVWCCTNYLPSSIANLWNLETLIVKGARIYSIPLPDAIWTMKSLRHIDIPTMSFRNYENNKSCHLHNVESFSTPTLTYGRDTEELLRRLPRLRKLKCNFFEIQLDNQDPIQFPVLSSLSQLESLNVYNCGDMLFGENQDQFPSFSFPNTLRKLTLEIFCLTRSAISIVGQLPNLEVLKLRQSAFLELRWDLEDGDFSNLKFLELSKVQIEQWNVCNEPLPCLERLVLKSCDSLEEIPSSLGDIPTLKKMEIYWCNKATSSAKHILEEQRDMGNNGLEVYILDSEGAYS